MSRENVEIVRRVYDGFTRHDAEAPFASYAPDIEWDITGLGQFGVASVYHAHAGVRACFRDLLSAFGRFELHASELQDNGEYVIATVSEQGVGRISGVVVDRRHYAVWTLQAARSCDCGYISITPRHCGQRASRSRSPRLPDARIDTGY